MPVARLVDLPPTAQIHDDLAAAETALARLAEAAPRTQAKAATLVASYHAQVRLAAQRDALVASRPAGCWCLGLGGRGARYVPPLDDDEEPAEVYDTYCECPEGAERRVEDDVHRAHYYAYREAHRVRRLFAAAGVPRHFAESTFETFPTSVASAPSVAAVRAWAQGEARQDSLLLYGDFGRGKTGLAVAAMRVWVVRQTTAALFITAPDLLDRIRASYGANRAGDAPTEQDLLTAVREVPLLVLDDLGAERPTDWVQEKLFGIVNARHDAHRATVFTSNLNPTALAAHLGERIAWRIVEMCALVAVDGPNLRVREAT